MISRRRATPRYIRFNANWAFAEEMYPEKYTKLWQLRNVDTGIRFDEEEWKFGTAKNGHLVSERRQFEGNKRKEIFLDYLVNGLHACDPVSFMASTWYTLREHSQVQDHLEICVHGRFEQDESSWFVYSEMYRVHRSKYLDVLGHFLTDENVFKILLSVLLSEDAQERQVAWLFVHGLLSLFVHEW